MYNQASALKKINLNLRREVYNQIISNILQHLERTSPRITLTP